MRTNRRKFMIGVGTTVAALSAGSSVIATEHTPLYFETINEEGDYVVIGNAGDEDFDLSGYIIDWEYNQQEDQTDEIPEGIVVPAGGTVKLASGYDEAGAEDADHSFDYDAGRIRDEGTDRIAIHEPGMDTLVITSGDHRDPPEDPNGDGDNGDDGDGDDGDDGDGDDRDDGDDGDGDRDGDDRDDDDGDDGDDRDDREGEDERETEPKEEEEVEGDDCPEEEKEEESDDDDCPEEEPEPEPKEDDCP